MTPESKRIKRCDSNSILSYNTTQMTFIEYLLHESHCIRLENKEESDLCSGLWKSKPKAVSESIAKSLINSSVCVFDHMPVKF